MTEPISRDFFKFYEYYDMTMVLGGFRSMTVIDFGQLVESRKSTTMSSITKKCTFTRLLSIFFINSVDV